jgi:ribosomal protein S18 acetylase RimI-like enzyme
MFKYSLFLLVLSYGILSNAEVSIRKYDSLKDYESVLRICQQNHDALDQDEYCSGEFNNVLLACLNSDAEIIRVRVLEYDPKSLVLTKTIIGFIIYSPVARIEDSFENVDILNRDFKTSKAACLAYIAIDPQFQHKGRGKMLLEHMLKDLNDQKSNAVYSSVKKTNTAAIEWHKQQGFTVVKDPLSLTKPYDYVLLKLALTPKAVQNTLSKFAPDVVEKISDGGKETVREGIMGDYFQELAIKRLLPSITAACAALNSETATLVARFFLRDGNPENIINYLLYKFRNSSKSVDDLQKISACFLDVLVKNQYRVRDEVLNGEEYLAKQRVIDLRMLPNVKDEL